MWILHMTRQALKELMQRLGLRFCFLWVLAESDLRQNYTLQTVLFTYSS